MNVFRTILLTLAAYRLTRLVTTDIITDFFRRDVDKRFGPRSNWAMLFHCPWCIGTYVTIAVFAVDQYLWTPPTWLLASVAAMTVVGLIGNFDE